MYLSNEFPLPTATIRICWSRWQVFWTCPFYVCDARAIICGTVSGLTEILVRFIDVECKDDPTRFYSL